MCLSARTAQFWLRFFPDDFRNSRPNAGHEALSAIAAAFPRVRIITQNIDGLHQSTNVRWQHGDQLAECHGRLGLYKCLQKPPKSAAAAAGADNASAAVLGSGDGRGASGDGAKRQQQQRCTYAQSRAIELRRFTPAVQALLRHDPEGAGGRSAKLTQEPRSVLCSRAS